MASSIVDVVTKENTDDEGADFDGEGVKDTLVSFRGSEDRESDDEEAEREVVEGATGGSGFWEDWSTGALDDLGTTEPEAGTRCTTVLTVTRLEVAPD